MTVHQLKIHQQPFDDLSSGAKNSEIRSNLDRDFQVGDTVNLHLIDGSGARLGDSLSRTITHIQTGYGLPGSLCVLSYANDSDHLRQRIAFLTGEIHAVANERDRLKARCAELDSSIDASISRTKENANDQ